jgi:hypothetical protein
MRLEPKVCENDVTLKMGKTISCGVGAMQSCDCDMLDRCSLWLGGFGGIYGQSVCSSHYLAKRHG